MCLTPCYLITLTNWLMSVLIKTTIISKSLRPQEYFPLNHVENKSSKLLLLEDVEGQVGFNVITQRAQDSAYTIYTNISPLGRQIT